MREFNTEINDSWTLAEVFLDLLQEKLLKFQKFYDLSIEERDALKTSDTHRLADVLQEKSQLQGNINRIDHQMKRLELLHPEFIRKMDSEQNVELKGTINLIAKLLQNIIDYEEMNKEIAHQNKQKIQHEMSEVTRGNRLLQSYFSRSSVNARFIDEAR